MNSVLHLVPEDVAQLKMRLPSALADGALVLLLCAQWCGTCRTFEQTAGALAQAYPDALFVWLDVEDDSVVAGDVDVDNFPSIAVFREGVGMHFGVSFPQEGVVKRLLGALLSNPVQAAEMPDEVRELPQILQQWLTRQP